jgi:ABC-type uncharacterized transport system ATPase subunit
VSVEIEGNTGFIKNLPMVKAVESDGNQLDISLVEDGDSQELLRLLTEQVRVQRFEVKVPSLHEIFVELVGKGNEQDF